MSEVMNVRGDECRGDECRTIYINMRGLVTIASKHWEVFTFTFFFLIFFNFHFHTYEGVGLYSE